MSKDNLKSINIEVTNEVWKKLKILSIQKEVSLAVAVRDILERHVSKKSVEVIEEN